MIIVDLMSIFYSKNGKRQLWVRPMGGWNPTLQAAWYDTSDTLSGRCFIFYEYFQGSSCRRASTTTILYTEYYYSHRNECERLKFADDLFMFLIVDVLGNSQNSVPMVFQPFIDALHTWYLVALGCGLSFWHLLLFVVCWLCFSLATSTDLYHTWYPLLIPGI